MALDAAAMVTLIDETIEARLGGFKKTGDAGSNLEHYTLDELRLLKREYQSQANAEAAQAAGGGSIGLTLINAKEPSP